MIFKNLEEYVEFVIGNKIGIKCPILYFQKTIDTQEIMDIECFQIH